MGELMEFVFPGREFGRRVSVEMIDGEPWFSAGDACAAIGLRNVSMAVSRLPERHRRISNADTNRGRRKKLVVTEPGLYALIVDSRRPEAEPFRWWIFEQLLPAIRTGDMAALSRFSSVAGFRKPPATLQAKLRRVYDAAMEAIDTGRDLDEQTADEMAEELGTTRKTLDRHLLQLDADGYLRVNIDAKVSAVAEATHRRLTDQGAAGKAAAVRRTMDDAEADA